MDNKYKAQEAWQRKAGLISKAYKLNSSVVEKFAAACEKQGVTQAKKLTELMEGFISDCNNKK